MIYSQEVDNELVHGLDGYCLHLLDPSTCISSLLMGLSSLLSAGRLHTSCSPLMLWCRSRQGVFVYEHAKQGKRVNGLSDKARSTYASSRNWENLQIACFEDCGKYGIPEMLPCTECDIDNWIGFNYARTCDKDERAIHGVHFHIDDYQFDRVWKEPERYGEMLKSFGAVMSPDFSIYPDFPDAIRIYNVYRNRWIGAYWQMMGLNVIPLVNWSTPKSFSFCFEGLPKHSIVSISTVGSWNRPETLKAFYTGWEEMLKRLEPTRVIVYGKILDGMQGVEMTRIKAFQDTIKERVEGRCTDG